jgi:hypothetical protein
MGSDDMKAAARCQYGEKSDIKSLIPFFAFSRSPAAPAAASVAREYSEAI